MNELAFFPAHCQLHSVDLPDIVIRFEISTASISAPVKARQIHFRAYIARFPDDTCSF
jgi:hypothetical protein